MILRLPQQKVNPPPDEGARGVSHKRATPPLLLEKLFKAWDPERAAKYEPILEETLREFVERGEQDSFDKLVSHFNVELDEALEVQQTRSLCAFFVDLGSRVITAVITPFIPKP